MTWIDEDELTDEVRANIERRRAAIARKATNPDNVEGGDGSMLPLATQNYRQDSARRAIDAAHRAGEINARQADKLDRLVRRDTIGRDADFIAAISDPAYASAFGKLLALGGRGRAELAQIHLTDGERAAFHRTVVASSGLQIGDPAAGGYAVPISLDPSVLASSDGSVNPWRQIARTITITGSNTWKGVSSDGVFAVFEAELAEVEDGTPTLAQPEIKVEKAHCFIPFSVEVGQDWGGIRDELLTMLADARERVEAEKFLTGSGSDEPTGILTALAASEFETATTGTLALDDIYAVKQDLGPRFQPRARWGMSPAMQDTVARLVGDSDPAEPQIFDTAGNLLRRPVTEVPDMSRTVSAGNQIAIYGDLKSAFAIVDRAGMSVELIPMLMGPSGRPQGQRGIYAWWRVGSGALVENAARILKVKS